MHGSGRCYERATRTAMIRLFRAATICVFGTSCGFALPAGAAAQPPADPAPRLEISAGYSFLGGGRIVDGHGPGLLMGAGWTVVDRLAIVVEAGSNRLRQDVGLLDVTADFHQLLTGARFTVGSGHVRPFAQALFGGSRIDYALSSTFQFPSSGIFDETRWAWQVGGGLEVPLTPASMRRFALRIGIDFRRVHTIEPVGQSRVHTLFVYRFFRR